MPRGLDLPCDEQLEESLALAFQTMFACVCKFERKNRLNTWICSHLQVPLRSRGFFCSGLQDGNHPLGLDYLPAVAEGYFVTEDQPLEVGYWSLMVVGRSKISKANPRKTLIPR
jgi:hypothetical protein